MEKRITIASLILVSPLLFSCIKKVAPSQPSDEVLPEATPSATSEAVSPSSEEFVPGARYAITYLLDGGEKTLTGNEATVYFYSEEMPAASGNYWHYVDGTPTIWANEG